MDGVGQDARADSGNRPDSTAKDICLRQTRLERERMAQDSLWDLVDRIATARRARFDIGSLTGVPDDQVAGNDIYDGTAAAAIRDFVDGWQARSASPLTAWFLPIFRSAQAKNLYSAQKWLDKCREVLTILMATSNWYEQINVAYADGVSHGIATMVGPDWHQQKRKFVSLEYHPREIFIMTDAAGDVDAWHRKYMLTGRQILAEFGEDALPESTRKLLERNPFVKHPIIHAIFRRDERDIHSPLAIDKEWASIYVYEERKIVLHEGGYDALDLPVTWRWWNSTDYPYPTSPTIDAIAEVSGVNNAVKSYLYAAQLSIRPPRLVSDTLKGEVRMTPDGETYASDPNQFVKPIDFPKQFQIGMEAIADMRSEVGKRLKGNIFSMLSQMQGKVTAYQANIINGEQTALAIPVTTRASSQLLVPMVNRFFQAAARMGMIPPPPPELMQFANTPVDIQMIGPMAMAAKRFLAQEGFTAFLALAEEINKVWPNVGNAIAEAVNADDVRKDLAEGSGVKAEYFLSDEQLQAVRQMKMKLMQEQQRQNALGNMADAYNKAKDAAEPGSLASQAMGGQR